MDGTPFFFINGHAIAGAVGPAEARRLIDATIEEAGTPKGK